MISSESVTYHIKELVDGKAVLVRLSVTDRDAVEAAARAESRNMGELLRLYAMPIVRSKFQQLREESPDKPHPPPRPRSGEHRLRQKGGA